MTDCEADVPDASLQEIQNELLGLTVAGERINEIQNSISEAQLCCDTLTDQYKKRMLYLRLKHKTRIDEAQAYHRAVKEAKEMAASAESQLRLHQNIMEKLAQAKEKLTIDVTPDSSAQVLSEINSLRESARRAYADYTSIRDIHTTKMLCVEDLSKRHRRSIELTREYFETTDLAQKTISEQRQTVDRLRKELVTWKERYKSHMDALECISQRKHLEAAMQGQLQEILEHQISVSETDVASIASFNVDSLEKDVINEMGSNLSVNSATSDLDDDNVGLSSSSNGTVHLNFSLCPNSEHSCLTVLGDVTLDGDPETSQLSSSPRICHAHISTSLPTSPHRTSTRATTNSFTAERSSTLVAPIARITHREEDVQFHPLMNLP